MQCRPPNHFITLPALLFLLCLVQSVADGAEPKTIRVALDKTTAMQAGPLGQPVTSFYTHVAIGTPPKPYKLVMDVGAKETWLPKYLTFGLFFSRLNYKNGYQKKDSSTSTKYEQEYSFDYRQCSLTGKAYEDIFVFTNATENPQEATVRQRFLAISSASNSRFSRLDIDGVISLNPSVMSDTGSSSLLVNLHRAKLIDELRFSLWFDTSLTSKIGGELTFGGVNPTRFYGSINYHSLAKLGDQWELHMNNVILGGEVVSCHQRDCTAVISTGTNDFYGPADDVAAIMDMLGVSRRAFEKDHGGHLYEIDCLRVAEVPDLTFSLDGKQYVVPATGYIKKLVDGLIFKSATCYVTILINESSDNQWILGTNFLAHQYSVFDLGRRQVGFAKRV